MNFRYKKFIVIALALAVFSGYSDNPVNAAETQNKLSKAVDNEFKYHEARIKKFPDNVYVVKSYLEFLEKNKFYIKAIELNQKLYTLTRDERYRIRAAELYMMQGEAARAVSLYEKIIAKNPDNLKALGSLIENSYKNGKFQQVLPYAERYLAKQENPEVQLMYGKSLFYTGFGVNAEKHLEAYIAQKPDDIDALKTLSDVYLSTNKFDKAASVLEKVVISDPENLELKTKLAESYLTSGNYAEARKIFRDLLIQYPDEIKFLSYIADANLGMGNFYEAANNIERIIFLTAAENPEAELKDLRVKLGEAYLASNKFDEAGQIFSNLVLKYPDDDKINRYYADTNLVLGNFDMARNILVKQVEKSPEDLSLKIKLSKALIGGDEFQEAKNLLVEMERKDTENKEVKELLGDVHKCLKDYNTALNYYNLVYSSSQNEDIAYKLAETYRLNKNYKESEKYYNPLRTSGKYEKGALLGIAYIRMSEGKLFKARDLFDYVSKKDPSNEEALIGLADVHISVEDFFHAINTLKKLPESDDKVNYRRALTYYKMGMTSDANKYLVNNKYEKAAELKQKIDSKNAFIIEPLYQLYTESADPANKLSFNRYGFEVSKVIGNNLKVGANFTITPYKSGELDNQTLSNLTGLDRNLVDQLLGSSFNGGSESVTATRYAINFKGRPNKNLAFNSEIGIMSLSNGKTVLDGNLIGDYFLNDRLSLRLGYQRYNIEETILSAAGLDYSAIGAGFVGPAMNNKFITGYTLRLPRYYYNFGAYHLGFIEGENLKTNFYQEGVLGFGKVLVTKPEGAFLDLVMPEYTLYAATYDKNLSGYGLENFARDAVVNPDLSVTYPLSGNQGGYFSPEYIVANKFAMHLRGSLKPIKSKYYLYGYTGVQNVADTSAQFIWGGYALLDVNEYGRTGMRLKYLIDDFEEGLRQTFIVNLVGRF